MATPLHVLILEDRPADAELMLHQLRRDGFDPDWQCVDNEADFRAALHPSVDIILADYSLPQWSATHAIRVLQETDLDIPLIIISGTLGEELAVACIKQGAVDFFLKDRLARLGSAVVNALNAKRLRVEKQQAVKTLRAREQQYRELIENLHSGIVVHAPDTRIILHNQKASELLGLSHDQMMGRTTADPVWNFIREDGSPMPTDEYPVNRVLASRQPLTNLVLGIGRPGTADRVWVLKNAFPVFNDQQEIEHIVVTFVDITDRKRAEEALRESEARVRTVIESAADAVISVDHEGNIIAWNRSAARIFGWAVDQIIGTNLTHIMPERVRDSYQHMMQRFEATRQLKIMGKSVEMVGLRADGSEFPMELTLSAWEVRGDLFFTAIVRDITERKQAAAALAQSAEQIRQLHEASKRLGEILDLEEVYETVYSVVRDVMDYDTLEVCSYVPGDNLIKWVYVRHNDQPLDEGHLPSTALQSEGGGIQSHVIQTGESLLLADYQSYLKTSQTQAYSAENKDDNEHGTGDNEKVSSTGAPIKRSALIVPLRITNEVVELIQVFSGQLNAFSEDDLRFLEALAPQIAVAALNARLFQELEQYSAFLEQAVAERTHELQTSEARYRAIIHDQTDLVCRFLPDGTLTFVNEAYCQYHDETSAQLIGQNFFTFLFDDDRIHVEKLLTTLSPENSVVRAEHLVPSGTGELRWMEWTKRALYDEQGTLLEIQAVGHDLTTHKQAEEMLQQALDREMEVNALRTRFTAMASHDLRTPLAVIQSTVDLLDQYGSRLSEERRQVKINQLNLTIKQMVALLDDLLLIGQVHAGKIKFSPAPIDLETFCQTIVNEIQVALGFQHTLNFSLTGTCTVQMLDPNLMRHILNNLLSNAIKYSPANSDVTFELVCQEHQTEIRITNKGIGISVADQKKLFEPFFRAGNVGAIKGSGLGLAIAKHAVELHGGTITCESDEGAGATFIITIPAVPAETRK
jgi:PAS domain S-box-containing protein